MLAPMQLTGHVFWVSVVQYLFFAASALYVTPLYTSGRVPRWQAKFVVVRSSHDSSTSGGHCSPALLAPMQLTGQDFCVMIVQYLFFAASASYSTDACTPVWQDASVVLGPSHDSNRATPSRQRPQLREHRRSTVSVQNLAFPASFSKWIGAQWIGVVCAGSAQSSTTSGGGSGHSGRSMHACLHLFLQSFLHLPGFS